MQKFNLSRKLFDLEEQSSEKSSDWVIYISSDNEDDAFRSWDSDWSTDTEMLIERIEKEVRSSPILVGGRIMTMEGMEDECEAGPSSAQPVLPSTPKLDLGYFDEKICYAPPRKIEKTKIELCKTLLPVLESPASPPEHEKGPVMDTPMHHSVSDNFHASFHIQDVLPYADLSKQRCQSCIVCGKSIDDIQQEKINWYMERSTPRSEPAYITALRREAYSNWLNAGSLLFLAPAVSQAAACDGTRITTTAYGQETTSGTLSIY